MFIIPLLDGWLRATCGAFERFTCSADINGYRYITNRH